MSRYAEVVVLARESENVMQPLTEPDPNREWHQCFTRVDDSVFAGSGTGSPECYMWVVQFTRNNWSGLLEHLESLPWGNPGSVQVLIHDEEDDCFGLWMMSDGKLREVPLPGATRTEFEGSSVTGILSRER